MSHQSPGSPVAAEGSSVANSIGKTLALGVRTAVVPNGRFIVTYDIPQTAPSTLQISELVSLVSSRFPLHDTPLTGFGLGSQRPRSSTSLKSKHGTTSATHSKTQPSQPISSSPANSSSDLTKDRTTALLDLEFHRLSRESVGQGSAFYGSRAHQALERPVLNIFCIWCDRSEDYRTNDRKYLREWLDKVQTKHNQEWLIIHFSGPVGNESTNPSSQAKFYQKSTVADKIRADFVGVSKKDRLLSLRVGQIGATPEDEGYLHELTEAIKDACLQGIEQTLASFEDDSRRSYAQRSYPGWNFCTYFILKERIAFIYEALAMSANALLQYDELDASFFQSYREGTLSWFGGAGGGSAGDDSADILDARRKPYRDLIAANSITMFDFRIYLFARQCGLLANDGKTIEIADRAVGFIPSLARTIQSLSGGTLDDFSEKWMFSAFHNVIAAIDRQAPRTVAPEERLRFVRQRFALASLANSQLDIMGSHRGLLKIDGVRTPESTPTQTQKQENLNGTTHLLSAIDLEKALTSIEHFTSFYVHNTLELIRDCKTLGRHRQTDLLWTRLSAVSGGKAISAEVQDFATAERRRKSTPWPEIDTIRSAQSLRKATEDGLMEEACRIILRILALTRDDAREDVALLQNLSLHSLQLGREIFEPNSRIFGLRILNLNASSLPDGEGSCIQVEVRSHLGVSVEATGLRLCLFGKHVDQLWFMCHQEHVVLKPGSSVFELSTFSPAAGTYTAEAIQICINKVILQYDVEKMLLDQHKPLIRIPPNPKASKIALELPHEVRLDGDRNLIIRLTAGHFDLISPVLRLLVPSKAIYLDLKKAHSGDEFLAVQKDQILLSTIRANTTFEIAIPFSTGSTEIVIVQMSLDYGAHDGRKRHVRQSKKIDLSFPIVVTVQDYFRQSCTISRFTIQGQNRNSLKILRADLEHAKGCLVEHCQPQTVFPMLVLDGQISSIVFKISHNTPQDGYSEDKGDLLLSLTYLDMTEHASQVILARLRRLLPQDDADEYCTLITSYITADLSPNSLLHYAEEGILDLGRYDARKWGSRLAEFLPSRSSLHSALLNVYEAGPLMCDDLAAHTYRRLLIPLVSPRPFTLHQVLLTAANGDQARLGVPASYHLLVTSTLTHRTESPVSGRQDFVRTLFIDPSSWLMSGKRQKHCSFVWELSPRGDAQEYRSEETIVLIPLRAGRIALPLVSIEARDPNIITETINLHQAMQIAVTGPNENVRLCIEV